MEVFLIRHKWITRILILVVIISVMFCVTIPAFARVQEANQYVWKVERSYDSGYDNGFYFYYNFPKTDAHVVVYDLSDSWKTIYSGVGASHSNIPFQKQHEYLIAICPFGYRSGENGLAVSSLPDKFSMQIAMYFEFSGNSNPSYSVGAPGCNLAFYKYDGTHVSDVSVPFNDKQNELTAVISEMFSLDPPYNAEVMTFEYIWNPVKFYQDNSTPTGIVIEDLQIVSFATYEEIFYDYDRYYTWSNGKIPEKSWFSSILNPTWHPDLDFGDYNQGEEDIIGSIEDNWDSVEQQLGGFATVLPEILPALLVWSWIIERFSQIHFFSTLLHVVMSLGITAFVLNLLITTINKFRSRDSGDGGGKKNE